MAIDSRTIDTELTLELDEDEITVSEFMSAFDHFLGLVKEVSKRVAPRRKNTWLVRLYPGSAGVGLYSKPGSITGGEMAAIRGAVMEGLEKLEGGTRPHVFSDRAIEHAKGISTVFKNRAKPSKIRIWSTNERALSVKPEIEAAAKKILEPVYEDVGSVEGTLEVLSGHGKFEVVVYDTIDQRAIKCELGQQQLDTAWKSFMKRVEVFGKIRYRSDGVAVSVRVDNIVPFPAKEEIPTLGEARGLLRE